MGANNFCDFGLGKDVKAVFAAVAEQARFEDGHDTYAGTIATKYDVYMAVNQPLTLRAAKSKMAEDLDKNRVDKWGPAACIEIKRTELSRPLFERMNAKRGDRLFMFYGLAPS